MADETADAPTEDQVGTPAVDDPPPEGEPVGDLPGDEPGEDAPAAETSELNDTSSAPVVVAAKPPAHAFIPENARRRLASAQEVREYLAANPVDDVSKPLRDVNPTTNELLIYCSMDDLRLWLPRAPWDKLTIWCKIPIFRVRFFHDRANFSVDARPYAEQCFPEGVDFLSAVLYWRKRVRQEGKGFAAFHGGFDTTGPVQVTDPPCVLIDGESGEVEADDQDEIDRKRLIHNKRMKMLKKWELKGVSEETRLKIESAEIKAMEKKRTGQEYVLRHGWVPRYSGQAEAIRRHNEIQKKFG